MHCSLLYGVFKWDDGTGRWAPAPRHRHNLFSSHNWLRSINQTQAGERREVPCSNQLSHWIWTETKPVSNDFQHGPSQCSALSPRSNHSPSWSMSEASLQNFARKLCFKSLQLHISGQNCVAAGSSSVGGEAAAEARQQEAAARPSTPLSGRRHPVPLGGHQHRSSLQLSSLYSPSDWIMMNDVLFNSPGLRLLAAPLRDQRRRTKSVAECGLVAGYGGVVQGPGAAGSPADEWCAPPPPLHLRLGFTAALLTCLNVTTPRHTLHGHRKPAHSR